MTPELLHQALMEAAGSLGWEVRETALPGDGGLVELKGKRIVFVPEAASAAVKSRVLARALSRTETESVYLLPAVREAIERERCSPTRSS